MSRIESVLLIIFLGAYFFIGLGAMACAKNGDCMFEVRSKSSFGNFIMFLFWWVYAFTKLGYLFVCAKDK